MKLEISENENVGNHICRSNMPDGIWGNVTLTLTQKLQQDQCSV